MWDLKSRRLMLNVDVEECALLIVSGKKIFFLDVFLHLFVTTECFTMIQPKVVQQKNQVFS